MLFLLLMPLLIIFSVLVVLDGLNNVLSPSSFPKLFNATLPVPPFPNGSEKMCQACRANSNSKTNIQIYICNI